MKKMATILLLLFPACWGQAQQREYIHGRVIDAETSEPVPFANVMLMESRQGVIANAEGDFRVLISASFEHDSLLISCIGYARQIIAIEELEADEINEFKLQPAAINLREVTIMGTVIDPEEIVREAIRNIDKNFPQEPFSYIAYYRDYQKKIDQYFNLNEAIVQTLDAGFNQRTDKNSHSLLDFRVNLEFPRINLSPYYGTSSQANSQVKYIPGATLPDQGGNELFILMVHDAIRNYRSRSFTFVNNFSRNFIRNHTFTGLTPVYNDDLLLYRISFEVNRDLIHDTLQIGGNIYIQPHNYAIHKLEYVAQYISDGTQKDMFQILVEYGHHNVQDSTMILKYISFNNIFYAPDPTDRNYFRVRNTGWDLSDPDFSTLLFEFSADVNQESANRHDNYTIFVNDSLAEIQTVLIEGNIVKVRLKNGHFTDFDTQSRVLFGDIRDVYGRILNERKFTEFYQFRELFVQEFNPSVSFNQDCLLEDKPLLENCVMPHSGSIEYWMNTPLGEE